jgi:hypothetical protein
LSPHPLRLPALSILVASPPALPNPRDPGVAVWRGPDGGAAVIAHVDGGQRWLHLAGLASFGFDERGDEVRAIRRREASDEVVLDAYQRHALPFILHANGSESLHASAVLAPWGVVAFCAASGAGKSTLAYALAGRGLPQWSDDVLVFECDGRGAWCHALPFRPRLLDDAAQQLRQRSAVPGPPSDGPHPRDGDRAPLAAIFVLEPQPTGRTPHVEAIGPAQAFSALLPHANAFSLHDPGRNEAMMEAYLALCAHVPVAVLRYAPGLDRLAAVVEVVADAIEEG